MRFTSTTALVIASLSIAACGGDDGGNPSVIDARRIDGTGGPDSTSSTCAFPASITFGDSTGFDLARTDSTMTAGAYRLTAGYYITEDMSAALEVQLYNTYAPFGTGAAPGAIDARTITIDSVQSSFETCGACLLMYSFVNGEVDTTWMPNGGSITISQIDPTIGGTYALAFNNLTLRQVEIDPSSGATTDSANGCATAFTGGSLAGAIVAPTANKANSNKLLTVPTRTK